MDRFEGGVASPLHDALDGFGTALDHLVKLVEDGGLDDLDAIGLVEFAQEFESVRNRMPLVDHALIGHAVERELPAKLCQRSMVRVLTSALLISGAEAARRVRAAEQLGSRRSMTGEPLGALRQRMAESQRGGEITAEQVAVIDRELRKVDGRGFDPAEVEAGERILVDAASSLGPEDLRGLALRVVEAIDPDGSMPDEEHQQARRFFHLRSASDGSFQGDFRLTPEVGQKLKAILDPLAAPQMTRFCVGEGGTSGTGADQGAAGAGKGQIEPDERTREQRMHDALAQVCDRLLRAGDLPDSGGVPTTVLITIDADALASRTEHGAFADGSPISARSVIELADQAGIAWCVRNSAGSVLTLGRTRRLASAGQTLALYARDGGCSFPGCGVEPAWCERHHVISWVDGGPTDLSNLTLVCRYHDHQFAQRGWRCRMTAEGLPTWIPPTWIDRQQRPILHPRDPVPAPQCQTLPGPRTALIGEARRVVP